MATVTLLTDDELSPEARAVFDDIRAVRLPMVAPTAFTPILPRLAPRE